VKDGPHLTGLVATAVQLTVLVPLPSALIVNVDPVGLSV